MAKIKTFLFCLLFAIFIIKSTSYASNEEYDPYKSYFPEKVFKEDKIKDLSNFNEKDICEWLWLTSIEVFNFNDNNYGSKTSKYYSTNRGYKQIHDSKVLVLSDLYDRNQPMVFWNVRGVVDKAHCLQNVKLSKDKAEYIGPLQIKTEKVFQQGVRSGELEVEISIVPSKSRDDFMLLAIDRWILPDFKSKESVN